MKITTYCFLLIHVLLFGKLNGQEIDTSAAQNSFSNFTPYQLFIDGGIDYFVETESGDFEPTYNLRLGVGKQFHYFPLYCFMEFTQYDYKVHTPLSPPSESSDQRYDIALYGMTTIVRIISLGIGIHYTHEDNVVLYDWSTSRVISQSGNRSYFGLYYLVGVGYPIRISDTISLPIGLDYHRAENTRNGRYVLDTEKTYVALHAGITLSFE
ncbi:MAG: hypothetical protein AB1728_10435 [Bacteroidota bacterium]